MDDAVRTKGEFGSWIQLRDRGRSTWNDRRPSGMNVKREERRSLPAQLLPSASPTVSLLFAELSSGEVSRRQPSSPPGYEIASLPRGVITKNQAKRPKSHHRASTLFLQFWRGAIDTHAGPLFARLSSRRSSLPPPLFLSLTRSLSRFLHGDPVNRAENTWEGKEFSRWLDSFVHSVNLLTGQILSYLYISEFIN